MKIYNTLTRQIDDLAPLTDEPVSIYTCGPTVYDHVHIGNLSSFIFADTLRRAIKAGGRAVKHVMNFTDVDDKTISRSQEVYKDLEPMEAVLKLTRSCSQKFLDDMKAVGNDVAALTFVKATDSINAMQALIRDLLQAGIAYQADDGIYFSIEAYKQAGHTYGQLSEVSSASTSTARIQNDEYDKESAHDFALWKAQKTNEPAWDFKLDGQNLKGRPGWHIECSAMSRQLLGQPFDIHTGGVDLIFPHHENEIAQSTGDGKHENLARIFAHNEHLLVDDQKMSKSLNNFYTLRDIQDRGYDPLAFRLLVLQAHYRSRAHFSWDNLEGAQNRLYDFRAMAALRWQALPTVNDSGTFALGEVVNQLTEIMSSDLNTPAALAFLSQISTQLSVVLIEEDMRDHFEGMIQGLDKLFGLNLMSIQDISTEQKNLIADRETARQHQDWQKADQIRDKLAGQGIGLRDTNQTVIWYPLPLHQK